MKITFLDTSMEKFESHGEGTWEVLGEQLKVMLSYLEKDKKMKVEPFLLPLIIVEGPVLIPGIESGKTRRENVSIPLTVFTV